jgi:DNA-binding MarR family transcriptional regulator
MSNDITPSGPSGQSIIHRMATIVRASRSHRMDKISSLKLGTGQQYTLLLVLLDQDGISQNRLARVLLLDKAGVARNIQQLERRGYIYRKKDPSDPRNNLVYLAEKTKKLRQELLSVAGNWLKKLLKNFSTTDYLQLMDLLARLETNARSALLPGTNEKTEKD